MGEIFFSNKIRYHFFAFGGGAGAFALVVVVVAVAVAVAVVAVAIAVAADGVACSPSSNAKSGVMTRSVSNDTGKCAPFFSTLLTIAYKREIEFRQNCVERNKLAIACARGSLPRRRQALAQRRLRRAHSVRPTRALDVH